MASEIEGSCHCGAVHFTVPALPSDLNDCQCGHCQRRGTLWAYYDRRDVRIVGETSSYIWGDRMLSFHFCPVCGCTTHWLPIDASEHRMGINGRMFGRELVALLPIRRSAGP